MRALWRIWWYNTDRSLEIGERSVFRFCGPEVALKPGYDLCFEDELVCEEDAEDDFRRATVEAIEHPAFGALDEVDTRTFGEYTFRFADGRWATIDTEQAQGVVLAASPDFAIDTSGPGWGVFRGAWDQYADWDLDVVLADVVESSYGELQAQLKAARRRNGEPRRSGRLPAAGLHAGLQPVEEPVDRVAHRVVPGEVPRLLVREPGDVPVAP